MQLNKACVAKPGHKTASSPKANTMRPTVLSVDRFNAIVGRSQQQEKQEQLEAVAEELRYKQYLKDGNEVLLSKFTNMIDLNNKDAEAVQAERDKMLAWDARIQKEKQNIELKHKRRIKDAQRIVDSLKPGARALRQAVITSETIHTGKYYDALKKKIENEAREQELKDERQCPRILIPFGNITEEQVKAEELAKRKEQREFYTKELESRRQRRIELEDQKKIDSIIERTRIECLKEKEDQAAKDLAAKKRQERLNAYQEALKEKAANAKYELMFDKIEDRVICVDRAKKSKLDARSKKEIKERREHRIRMMDAYVSQIEKDNQKQQQKAKELEDLVSERYDQELHVDEMRRQFEVERLRKERRAYEQAHQAKEEGRKERRAEIRRFEVAARLKNMDVNQKFRDSIQRQKDKETIELRKDLQTQQQEYRAQMKADKMRISACNDDTYMEDDVKFFDKAVELMEQAKSLGRPLRPIAKAVETYRAENNLDNQPKSQRLTRTKLRDCCWPGYISKADLAYSKYEHRDNCQQEKTQQLKKIQYNCSRIKEMVTAEHPYVPCANELTISGNPSTLPIIKSIPSREKNEMPMIEDAPEEIEEQLQAENNPKAEECICVPSAAKSERTTGGQAGSWIVPPAPPRAVKRRQPQLASYWTAKPAAKPKIEATVPHYPIVKSIDPRRTAKGLGGKCDHLENRKQIL